MRDDLMLSCLVVASVVLITVLLVWRFNDTIPGTLPFVSCAVGLVLYILAFVNRMSWIDFILIAAGCGALYGLIVMARRKGIAALRMEIKRQLSDTHFITGLIIIFLMCLMLRTEQILEWDGYNFWGPDIKSLYFRDGFAPKYSNVSPKYGNYPPMIQITLWLLPHLLERYQENYVFMAYYAFGAILLFSVADRFRASQKKYAFIVSVISCVGAVVLPGAACTAWFRALYVDPLMAILFGVSLGLVVCRDNTHTGFWKSKFIISISYLALVKSISFVWSLLALLFFCLWWLQEKHDKRFVAVCTGSIVLFYGSWSIFCRVMERTSALETTFYSIAAQRLKELAEGNFLSAGDNWGYITSYGRAILCTPLHREYTTALDLSPAALIIILFAAAFILWKHDFIPRKKIKRLILFMNLCIIWIYATVLIGQMTMFYSEQQYLEPVKAVTLLTRYAAPAHMGLLILLVTFASGKSIVDKEVDSLTAKGGVDKRIVSFILTGILLFSCGAYSEMERRFVYDELDASRIEKREMFCIEYNGFLQAIKNIPTDEKNCRVLLGLYQTYINPIVINEASPISFVWISFTENAVQDMEALNTALKENHAGYLYVEDCPENLSALLSKYVVKGNFKPDQLYKIDSNNGLILKTVEAASEIN